MLDCVYNFLSKMVEKERRDRWICAGATEGLEHYFNRFGKYPEYVVDIGAHYGSLSKAALEHGAKQVIAIEASAENYKKMLSNLKKYKITLRFLAFNEAFCDNIYEYKVKLIANKKGNSGQKSLIYITDNAEGMTYEYCSSIDSLCLLGMMKHNIIDYLKIDIEGGEFYALPFDDATRRLFAKTRFLDIELHSLDNPNYFDKQAFLDAHPEYDPDKDMIVQFVDFLTSCGFYAPSQDISGQGAVKLMTANRNLER